MKTIINQITEEVARAQFNDLNLAENEVAIDELYTGSFVLAKFNFTTRLFYEGATAEQVTIENEIREEAQDQTEFERIQKLGVDLIAKTKKRLIRRIIKSQINKANAKKVRELLNPSFLFLLTADLDIALDVANLIPVQTNSNVQAEIQNYRDKLTIEITKV